MLPHLKEGLELIDFQKRTAWYLARWSLHMWRAVGTRHWLLWLVNGYTDESYQNLLGGITDLCDDLAKSEAGRGLATYQAEQLEEACAQYKRTIATCTNTLTKQQDEINRQQALLIAVDQQADTQQRLYAEIIREYAKLHDKYTEALRLLER